MHVLHVAQPTTAGVAVVVRALVQDQVGRGLQVSVACPDDGDLARWSEAAGAVWERWHAVREVGRPVVGETFGLARGVRRVRPDLVHLHSAKAGLAGRLALRGAVPTVFQPHAWSFEAAEGRTARAAAVWERTATRWTDLLVCVSEDEACRGRDLGVRARTLVNPNGVDLTRWVRADAAARPRARATLGLPDGPLVVCPGRLSRQKGQDVLLRALPALRRAVPDVHVVLVGDGPDRQALEAVDPRVRLVGAQDDLAPWLQAADVVALPSRWEAGLPLVAQEAMAVGRPVVVSAVAGTGDLGPAARVVPVDDADALAAAVELLLRNPAAVADAVEHGRRRVERYHDFSASAGRAAAAYEDVLARRGGR